MKMLYMYGNETAPDTSGEAVGLACSPLYETDCTRTYRD